MANKVLLPSTAKQIKNSKDFADIDGRIYTEITNYQGKSTKKYIQKTPHINHGYLYIGIYDNTTKKCKQHRLHRVIAETFLPNPNKLPIVGHKNNIKTDCRIENLYWTTNKENIQKAVNDGLLKNDKSYDDSQSKPVIMFDSRTNKEINKFGSICEAVRQTGIAKTTIARQAKYHRPTRKPFYFRYEDDESCIKNKLVGKFHYDSNHLVATYFNIADAARQNHMNKKTIGQQCSKGKPTIKYNNHYYQYIEI